MAQKSSCLALTLGKKTRRLGLADRSGGNVHDSYAPGYRLYTARVGGPGWVPCGRCCILWALKRYFNIRAKGGIVFHHPARPGSRTTKTSLIHADKRCEPTQRALDALQSFSARLMTVFGQFKIASPWAERCPRRHAVHERTRTAQEGLHGIVVLDDGTEGLRASKQLLSTAKIVCAVVPRSTPSWTSFCRSCGVSCRGGRRQPLL